MKYLVEIEGGKNGMGTTDLHIIKTSVLVEGMTPEQILKRYNLQDGYQFNHSTSTVIYIFGHIPDYQLVTNITEL